MDALTGLPWWILIPASLVLVSGSSLLLRAIATRLVGSDAGRAAAHAGPLMPALGALFAFMTGFAITAMWSAHTNAEVAVAREATAASTLAWAATSPGVDTASVQGALSDYLDTVLSGQWERLGDAPAAAEITSTELTDLQRTVRSSTSDPAVSQADAAELLASVDELAAQGSARIGAAAGSMPLPLFLALLITGLAACLNALIISIDGTRRSRWVTTSIIVVVAVDLAVLLILSGPFNGSQQVSNAPIVAVRDQIVAGDISR